MVSKVWDFSLCKLAQSEGKDGLLLKICLFIGLLNMGGGMVLESSHWLLLCLVPVSGNIIFNQLLLVSGCGGSTGH